MTMPEAKSIEEQLIKISLRTLAAILIGVVVGVGTAVSMYSNIILTQERILNEVTKTRKDFEIQIMDIRNDVKDIQLEVNQMTGSHD